MKKKKARQLRALHPRDPQSTQLRILEAATHEFAAHGLGGARIDLIASRSEANKRMIYHYFGSKDELFKAVLEHAYQQFRESELNLRLDELEPEAALARLVEFTWNYHHEHPEFLNLVNSANLHKARHLKGSRVLEAQRGPFIGLMQKILKRGVEQGVFRPGVDPVQLMITIAAISYYYFTNRHTGALVYSRDLMTPKALSERLAFNIETILRLVRKS